MTAALAELDEQSRLLVSLERNQHELIRRAAEAGASEGSIAEAAGLSRQSVHEIVAVSTGTPRSRSA